MFAAKATPIPPGSALAAYAARPGCQTDCFALDVPGTISLESYIPIFFDTWLFRLERRILALARIPNTGLPSIAALASGDANGFAAWQVETRSQTDLLMCVIDSPIRTWLRATPAPNPATTRLYFGSAVLPTTTSTKGEALVARSISLLTPLHLIYTRALLGAAARKSKSIGKAAH